MKRSTHALTDISDKRFLNSWKGTFVTTEFTEETKEQVLKELQKLSRLVDTHQLQISARYTNQRELNPQTVEASHADPLFFHADASVVKDNEKETNSESLPELGQMNPTIA